MIKNSYIYTGNVIHKRFKPKIHSFNYSVFSLLIDLSEINLLHKTLKIFSYNKLNIISFFDKDHGARDGSSLKDWVLDNLKKNNIDTNDVKIKLLCYPRIFGYVFNPLSVFYVYDKNSDLISILYEVKNTFGEQHVYVFKTEKDQNLIQHVCKKKFHVSPFIEMNCIYFFRLLKPGNKISVIIDLNDPVGKVLYASQDGIKSELNNRNLLKSYLKHPLMTFKIIIAIHYEAFKLWTKGIKFIKKKIKIKNNITIENYSSDTTGAASGATVSDNKWVSIYGIRNRVDHCTFIDKWNGGATVVVWYDNSNYPQRSTPTYHLIDSNYFNKRSFISGNGGESIRVGVGLTSSTYAYNVIEYNLFENLTQTEPEVISNKSGFNTYRYNTIKNSSGGLTLTRAVLFDPSSLSSLSVATNQANDDFLNPFTTAIDIKGNNQGGSGLSGTTYTIPLTDTLNQILSSTYKDLIIIIRYNGQPSTPVSTITVSFS